MLIFLPHHNDQTHPFLNDKLLIQKRKKKDISLSYLVELSFLAKNDHTKAVECISRMNCLKMNGLAQISNKCIL